MNINKPAMVIPCVGEPYAVVPDDGKHFTLDEIYSVLKMTGNPNPTFCTCPTVVEGRILIVEDNGIALGLPFNKNASQFAQRAAMMPGVGIRGNALFIWEEQIE